MIFSSIILELNAQAIINEGFESGSFSPFISFQTTGTFTSAPGIINNTNFGSANAFSFGRSNCASSCFNNYVTTLIITFPAPTYVDSIKWKEMEIYGNWGSQGQVFLDDVVFDGATLGAMPVNSGVPDATPQLKNFSINQMVTTIKFKVSDITNASEIILDDLQITYTPTPLIAGYEYWFNNDFANKTRTSVTQTQQLLINELIPTTGLKNGINTFNFRSFDNLGMYSSVLSHFFYKPSSLQNNTNPEIVAYEYWLDNDYVNAVLVNTPFQQLVNINELIAMTSLNNGVHQFNIRFKDNMGLWSSVVSNFFYKVPEQIVAQNTITEYCYWFDNDFANAANISLTPNQQIILIDNLDLTQIPKGDHEINFQFKDTLGLWSVVLTDTIEKIALPIADFSYSAMQYCDSTVIAFTENSIDGDVYLWDFADGTTDTLANPTHTFYNSRLHSVSLTVSDTITFADSTKQIDILITGHTEHSFSVTSCDSYTSPSGNYTYTTSGVYYDTILNHWGCDSLLTIDLNIAHSFFNEENINICSNETYSWHGNNFSSSGTYYDSLTTVNGCDSVYKLNLIVNPIPIVNLGADIIHCGDTTVTLNAGAGFTTYQWNIPSNTSSTLTVNTSGTYSVTVTNAEACTGSDEINVTISNISINLEQIGADLIATINPIVPGEYAWYTCDNQLVPNITTPIYQNVPIDECFYVIFTDEENCEWISNEVNVVSIQDNAMNIARVYPNPANDIVYIELLNDKTASIYLYDMLGKLILNEKHDNSQIKLDVSQLNGTYILKVVNDNKQSIFKLTIID